MSQPSESSETPPKAFQVCIPLDSAGMLTLNIAANLEDFPVVADTLVRLVDRKSLSSVMDWLLAHAKVFGVESMIGALYEQIGKITNRVNPVISPVEVFARYERQA